jgi:hypothetical protein
MTNEQKEKLRDIVINSEKSRYPFIHYKFKDKIGQEIILNKIIYKIESFPEWSILNCIADVEHNLSQDE